MLLIMLQQNESKKWSLFLSHSHKDKKFVDWLKSRMDYMNISVWQDSCEILIGDRFKDKIKEGVTRSLFFLIIISNDSIQSKWVKQELEWFESCHHDQEPTILPIILDEPEINLEDFPLLKETHAITFPKNSPDKFNKITSINNKLQELRSSISRHFEQKDLVEEFNCIKPKHDNLLDSLKKYAEHAISWQIMLKDLNQLKDNLNMTLSDITLRTNKRINLSECMSRWQYANVTLKIYLDSFSDKFERSVINIYKKECYEDWNEIIKNEINFVNKAFQEENKWDILDFMTSCNKILKNLSEQIAFVQLRLNKTQKKTNQSIDNLQKCIDQFKHELIIY